MNQPSLPSVDVCLSLCTQEKEPKHLSLGLLLSCGTAGYKPARESLKPFYRGKVVDYPLRIGEHHRILVQK